MNQRVNPVVAVVIAVAVLAAVGFVSIKLFGGGSGGSESSGYKIRPANPNSKEFRPDPRLGGGGG